jgi:hypothetical protein
MVVFFCLLAFFLPFFSFSSIYLSIRPSSGTSVSAHLLFPSSLHWLRTYSGLNNPIRIRIAGGGATGLSPGLLAEGRRP